MLSQLKNESKSVYFGILSALISALIAFVTFLVVGNQSFSLFDENPIGRYILAYLAVALPVVYGLNISQSQLMQFLPKKRIIDKPFFVALTLLIPYLGFFYLGLLMFSRLLQASFEGAQMHWLMGIIYMAVCCGLVTYIAVSFVLKLKPLSVAKIFALFMLVGVFASTLVTENNAWWQESVSYLGYDSGSRLLFKTTMIVGGLMLIIIGRLIFIGLSSAVKLSKLSEISLKWGGVSLGILTAMIGIFDVGPAGFANTMHMLAANLLGALCIAAMMGTRWYLRFMPKYFHNFSLSIGSLFIFLGLLYYIAGIVSFAVMELLVFVLAGMWLYVLSESAVEFVTSENSKFEFEQKNK